MLSSWFQHTFLLLNAVNPESQAASSNFLHYYHSTDVVGKTLWVILLIMALITWYLIFAKSIGGFLRKQKSRKFFKEFWDQHPDAQQTMQYLASEDARDNPFGRITRAAFQAHRHVDIASPTPGSAAGHQADLVTRAIRKEIDIETSKLEKGLTMLGSIGSTAPFVGLFGTVWGVFHALTSISGGNGYNIDQVAGPVGEALIMTGMGLAVAIPAVLALNAFVRRNRLALAQIDNFAYDVFTLVSTGTPINDHSDFSRGNFEQKSSVLK